jgi:hypothetical protein
VICLASEIPGYSFRSGRPAFPPTGLNDTHETAMKTMGDGDQAGRRRNWRLEDGKLYFTPRLERKAFFVLTLVMLLAGIGYRMLGG